MILSSRPNIKRFIPPVCPYAQNMSLNMFLKDKYENKYQYAGFVYTFIFLMKQLVFVVLERAVHNNVNKNKIHIILVASAVFRIS